MSKIVIEKFVLNQQSGSTLAYGTVNIADKIIIFSCRLMQGNEGMFVSYPARKGTDDKWYNNVLIKDEALRNQIQEAFIGEFSKAKSGGAEQPAVEADADPFNV